MKQHINSSIPKQMETLQRKHESDFSELEIKAAVEELFRNITCYQNEDVTVHISCKQNKKGTVAAEATVKVLFYGDGVDVPSAETEIKHRWVAYRLFSDDEEATN